MNALHSALALALFTSGPAAAQVTLVAGDLDFFNPGGPLSDPRPELAALVAPMEFDVLPGCGLSPLNRTVVHSFRDLPDRLLGATLRFRVRGGCGGSVDNDGIGLLFAEAGATDLCSSIAWGGYFGPVSAPESLCLSTGDDPGILPSWSFQDQLLYTLDLAELPTPTGTLSLLEQIELYGFLDVAIGDETGVDFLELTYERAIGAPGCVGALNSTGVGGGLEAFGSPDVGEDDVTLRAFDLPLVASGYFLASRAAGFVPNPGGSQGNLCLGAPIGRFVGPGQVQNSGLAGGFTLRLGVGVLPQPTTNVPALPGETWWFQAWHRDQGASGPTSNFTASIAITFQ